MKKICLILIIIFTILILPGCKNSKKRVYQAFEPLEKEELDLVVSSDMHFISRKMIGAESVLTKPYFTGDGRIIAYNEYLIDAFIEQLLERKPDALIITGDLTYDGSKTNHEELASKLNVLVKAGIRVLVSPGNHDLNSSIARYYEKGKTTKVDSINATEFETIYYNLGFGNALEKDKDSLSYVYKISTKLWVVMLDSAIYYESDESKSLSSGLIKDSTLNWLEKILQKAKENNAQVITTSHHNLTVHTDLFTAGFLLNNHDDLSALLNKYQVKLHLSGHLHIQHVAYEKNITEITTSSLAMYSHHYGVIKTSPTVFDYSTEDVDMVSYATKHNIENEHLKNFPNYALEFFQKASYNKTYDSMMFDDSSMYKEAKSFATAQAILNPYYFNGNSCEVVEQALNDESYEIWSQYPTWRRYKYLMSMIEAGYRDHRYEKIYLLVE